METTTTDNSELYRGVCKWFSSKKGFGFVTITSDNKKNEDIFVHQSELKPVNNTFRTLVQGEYVQFKLENTGDSDNKVKAVHVCGIDGGALMCEQKQRKFYKPSETE